MLLGFVVTV